MASKTPTTPTTSTKAAEPAKAPAPVPAAAKPATPAGPKTRILDPKRDPKSYTAEEFKQMYESGELQMTFTQENFQKFVLGEITWSQLSGMTMEDAYSFAQIAYNLFEQGKYAQAQTIVEGLVISNPYDGYFHSLLGSIYARKGMQDEAVEEYSIAIQLDSRNALSSYVNRAEIRLQQGDLESAMKDLTEAVKLDPEGKQPFGVRARALAAAAMAVLDEVVKRTGADGKKDAKTASKPSAKPAAPSASAAKPAPAAPAKPAAKPAGPPVKAPPSKPTTK